ncbi:hypothetical protein R6Z07F_015048 [Ovis aries]
MRSRWWNELETGPTRTDQRGKRKRAKSGGSWELGVTRNRSRGLGVRELVFRREEAWTGRGHRRSSTAGDSTASDALVFREAAGDAGAEGCLEKFRGEG